MATGAAKIGNRVAYLAVSSPVVDDATPGQTGIPGALTAPEARDYRFGDLLALARRSWVRRLSSRATSDGFADYRRSDTVLLRILAREAQPIGRIGDALGISRQGARKLADGLVARGYAELGGDPSDARRTLVRLTDRGVAYHHTLAEASRSLDEEMRRLPFSDLVAADAVLRAVLTADDRRLADAAVPSPVAGFAR